MSIFELSYLFFEEESGSRDWYVEGYASVMGPENIIPYAWIREYDGTILDIGSRDDIIQFTPITEYSHEELDAIADLIENGDYGFPLCENYGSARFTVDNINSFRSRKRNTALKRSEPEWDEESGSWIYPENRGRGRPRKNPPKPYGPKRPRGRPKKYKWSDSVNSSNLEHIYYDANQEMMTVDFVKGPTYEYYGVSKKRYDNLKRAKSKGKYFHKYIRFSYPYDRTKG